MDFRNKTCNNSITNVNSPDLRSSFKAKMVRWQFIVLFPVYTYRTRSSNFMYDPFCRPSRAHFNRRDEYRPDIFNNGKRVFRTSHHFVKIEIGQIGDQTDSEKAESVWYLEIEFRVLQVSDSGNVGRNNKPKGLCRGQKRRARCRRRHGQCAP